MLAWLRSWKGGLVVSVACLVAGLVRLSAAPVDLQTVALFPLAAGYAGAAVVERRMSNARRAAAGADGPDPTPWTTQPSRLVAWLGAERGYAGGAIVTIPVATSTKDRVGAVLAIVAAVVGLVLVFHDRGREHAPVVSTVVICLSAAGATIDG